MKSHKLIKLALLAIFVATIGTNYAYAGGSSYEISFEGKTSFARPGTTVYGAQKIIIQTYFRFPQTDLSRNTQLKIDSIRLTCGGDDVIRHANVRIGSKTYGGADFGKSPLDKNMHDATIYPDKMILENISYHLVSVDLVTDARVASTSVAECDITDIVHTVGEPGGEFTSQTGYAIITEHKPSAIVVGNLDLFYYSYLIGGNFDLKRPLTNYMRGYVQKTKTGSPTLTVENKNWDANAFYVVMLTYHTNTSVTFDILRPYFLPAGAVNKWKELAIQELHLYKKPAANGSVGSIVLEY